MALFTLGVNHQTADIAQRERLARLFQSRPPAMQRLFKEGAVLEAVVLSTCNRTELYAVTRCHHAVKEWLTRQSLADEARLWPMIYERHDLAMVKHLMAVASGLDSAVLGEPQILGQMKAAYQTALSVGTVGQQFQRLFPAVFEAAKRVRFETDIGRHPVTTTYAVMQLAQKAGFDLKRSTVLLIGAGETAGLLASYLHRHGVKRLMVANRTLGRAHNLVRSYGGVPIRFSEMPSALCEADCVMSATASEAFILSYETVVKAMQERPHRPLFMADLAVPRDMDPTIASIPNVALYNIDQLQAVTSQNRVARQEVVSRAEAIIDVAALHYSRQLRVKEAGAMIHRYRQKMEHCRDEELQRSLQALQTAQNPAVVMTELARRLTNKFMHAPTTKLREAAYAERSTLLNLIRELHEL